MYFVQIVNDGTPGALYEAGDDMAQAQELLLKVVASGRGNVEGPTEIDDDVREFVESEGYFGNVFIVSSEAWSDAPDAYDGE
jgi:fatty acid/phospholipid biosynthesis enzyme